MLIYNELKNKPREFLAATGLKLDEFEQLAAPAKFEAELFTGKPASGPFCGAIR